MAPLTGWLPWHRPLRGRRCRAVLEPNDTAYHGRCELDVHLPAIGHALERGMVIVRWPVAYPTLEGP